MSTPAQRILRYIEENGIKQSFVARKINMKENTLSNKLKGKSRITPEEMELLCWTLGKSPNDFIKPRAPKGSE